MSIRSLTAVQLGKKIQAGEVSCTDRKCGIRSPQLRDNLQRRSTETCRSGAEND